MKRRPAPGPLALAGRCAGAGLLAAAIFAIDTATTLGSAVAVMYVVVLIIVADAGAHRVLALATAGCIALTLVSFAIVHGEDASLEVVLRLLFSLAAIIATALILLRRHADKLTLESQAELLDVTSDAIYLTDAKGRVLYWNKGAERLYGWSFDAAWGRDPHDFLATRFPAPRAAIEAALAASGTWEGEIVQTTRAGATLHLASRWRRTGAGGRPGAILQSNTDISERIAADAALRRSEQRYRTIFETLAVAIWEHDLRPLKAELDAIVASGVTDLERHLAEHPEIGRRLRALTPVTDVNGTALRLMGVASKGEFFTRLDEFLPDNAQNFGNFLVALSTGQPSYEAETTVRTRSGELLRVLVAFNFPPDGNLDRVQASVVNITERVKAQEALERARGQLEHALRAATLGEVSATIAHEINQPLAAIAANAAAGRRWLDRDPPDLGEVRLALDEAAAAARRASEVVRRVRRMMGKVEPERSLVEIGALVEEALHLLAPDIAAAQVALAPAIEAAGARIDGDRVLIQQVLMNLAINAMQAMQALPADERRLSVRARRAEGRIVIDVADSGPGFSAEAAEKAFEPFYTTKPNGMGLGLAMCRSIITAHEGEIRIHPAGPEGGGRVTLALPLAPET
ncbi:sensor histidine kinase [Ancylobacter terrae]|uniref:sensor histidine kinase n=1 Tax=Ancylobacter sp. sgz301288 TaxID=3342077 RepID=UPI003859E6FF